MVGSPCYTSFKERLMIERTSPSNFDLPVQGELKASSQLLVRQKLFNWTGNYFASIITTCRKLLIRQRVRRIQVALRGRYAVSVQDGPNSIINTATDSVGKPVIGSYDRQIEKLSLCLMGVQDDRHPVKAHKAKRVKSSVMLGTTRIPELGRQFSMTTLSDTGSVVCMLAVFQSKAFSPEQEK
jgi:hypothetical protein